MEAAPENSENLNLWVPAKGDFVKLKQNFVGSVEALALGLGELRGLGPGKLYKVINYIQNEERRALELEEVKVVTVMGKRYETPAGKILFTPPLHFFEPVRYKKTS